MNRVERSRKPSGKSRKWKPPWNLHFNSILLMRWRFPTSMHPQHTCKKPLAFLKPKTMLKETVILLQDEDAAKGWLHE
ncbi:MAG: hypothetical protein Ct9H90mP9_6210 [Pseudomonadota bacterium]|nr:MAG: hypothetical protein Ct9H90mP9_6210 [Pseudomonadota bacterium]